METLADRDAHQWTLLTQRHLGIPPASSVRELGSMHGNPTVQASARFYINRSPDFFQALYVCNT
jgi:hypothetical protein